MFMPPMLGNVNGPLGAIDIGTPAAARTGPASAYDPETHVVYAQAGNVGVVARSLVAPPKGFSDIRYVSGVAGRAVPRGARARRRLRGRCAAAAQPQRAPPTLRRRPAGRGAADAAAAGGGAERAGAADRQAAVRRARRRSISIAAS